MSETPISVEGPADAPLTVVPAHGDHSFKPRKRSGHTEEGNRVWAVERADEFLKGLVSQGG